MKKFLILGLILAASSVASAQKAMYIDCKASDGSEFLRGTVTSQEPFEYGTVTVLSSELYQGQNGNSSGDEYVRAIQENGDYKFDTQLDTIGRYKYAFYLKGSMFDNDTPGITSWISYYDSQNPPPNGNWPQIEVTCSSQCVSGCDQSGGPLQ